MYSILLKQSISKHKNINAMSLNNKKKSEGKNKRELNYANLIRGWGEDRRCIFAGYGILVDCRSKNFQLMIVIIH